MQTEMMPLVNELAAVEAARLEQVHADNLAYVEKYRGHGTATVEDCHRNARPEWVWDDYSI